MKKYLAVLIFGTFGGICRTAISNLFVLSNHFPLGTLIVNLIGCFLFSIAIHYIALTFPLNSDIISGLSVGFVGAFTTFSGLSVDSIILLHSHEYLLLGIYNSASIIGGIGFAILGILTSQHLISRREHW
ncbi:fluoride efflux transporter FluC [Paucilactobacillus hokkaidonensis]|uniref:Fluoride-specific ion channel FluC n=1 Tax=Paucilactobacillus hokkaidonensis TaxID=1193095 RepID=A0ABR5Q868_9LACO|nr:CrcB family protein [Paucilactobacillus hokkaidonensis]KRO11422.1 hypothetical protein IV59_GL000162 [Paucilactobacillus hokkaidonensis]